MSGLRIRLTRFIRLCCGRHRRVGFGLDLIEVLKKTEPEDGYRRVRQLKPQSSKRCAKPFLAAGSSGHFASDKFSPPAVIAENDDIRLRIDEVSIGEVAIDVSGIVDGYWDRSKISRCV